MPGDYGYLNARIRAMKSRLFDRHTYNELLAKGDLQDLLASLTQTSYRVGMEAALARYSGWDALRDGLRRDLTATLRRVRSMVLDEPDSEPAQLVRILLARWDHRNLLTVLRQQIQGPAQAAELDLLAPVGDLDETALTELLQQADLRAMISLATTWRLPFAGALRDALPALTATGNPAILEYVLDRHYAARLQAWLGELPPSENVLLVRQVLGWERDLANLLTTLRLRQAQLRDHPGRIATSSSAVASPARDANQWYLPGGQLSQGLLLALQEEPAAERVYHLLARSPHTSTWLSALAGWVEHGSLTATQRALERHLTAMRIALFQHDPLTIAPVIAYIAAKENEARNLRLIGMGMVHGLPHEYVAAELLITE